MKRKNDRLEHWTQVITDKYDNAYRKFNSKTKALECALVDCDKLQKQNVLKENISSQVQNGGTEWLRRLTM